MRSDTIQNIDGHYWMPVHKKANQKQPMNKLEYLEALVDNDKG
jgi:hypothetical protein